MDPQRRRRMLKTQLPEANSVVNNRYSSCTADFGSRISVLGGCERKLTAYVLGTDERVQIRCDTTIPRTPVVDSDWLWP